MKTLFALSFTALFASAALAGPTCNVPQEKWMKEADFKAKVEAQGYKIKTFKVTKNDCYEIYGFDKEGRKVEIYHDPVSGKAVKTEIDD